jgi:hypothetical protein
MCTGLFDNLYKVRLDRHIQHSKAVFMLLESLKTCFDQNCFPVPQELTAESLVELAESISEPLPSTFAWILTSLPVNKMNVNATKLKLQKKISDEFNLDCEPVLTILEPPLRTWLRCIATADELKNDHDAFDDTFTYDDFYSIFEHLIMTPANSQPPRLVSSYASMLMVKVAPNGDVKINTKFTQHSFCDHLAPRLAQAVQLMTNSTDTHANEAVDTALLQVFKFQYARVDLNSLDGWKSTSLFAKVSVKLPTHFPNSKIVANLEKGSIKVAAMPRTMMKMTRNFLVGHPSLDDFVFQEFENIVGFNLIWNAISAINKNLR